MVKQVRAQAGLRQAGRRGDAEGALKLGAVLKEKAISPRRRPPISEPSSWDCPQPHATWGCCLENRAISRALRARSGEAIKAATQAPRTTSVYCCNRRETWPAPRPAYRRAGERGTPKLAQTG